MKKILLFIHIYYPSQRTILIEHIKRIHSHDLSIVLTVDPANVDALAVAHDIALSFNVLKIVHCPNRGMDVMPFLKAINAVGDEIKQYHIAIKFHTKNTLSQRAIDINSIYFKYLFENTLLSQIIDQKLDFCAPLSLMRLGNNMIYRNRRNLEKILHIVSNCTNNCSFIDGASAIHLINSPTWLFSCGTMFVLSQRVLYSLQALALDICQLFDEENYSGQTRDDGSIAHAMERYFGFHIKLMQGTYGFMHHSSPDTLAITKAYFSGHELELSCYFDQFLVKERHDQLYQLQHCDLDQCDLDTACHDMHIRGLPRYNMNPLIKYYMYGDIYCVPLPNFEPSIFLIKHKPVYLAKQSAFLGWLLYKRGIHQNIDNKSFDCFWDIGLQLGLVDVDYLYHKVLASGSIVNKKYLREFYKSVGSALLMPASKNFRPKNIPVLVQHSIEKKRLNPLEDYISNFYLTHICLAKNVMSNIQAQDYEGSFNSLKILEDSFGISCQTAQANAYLSFVRGDLDSAAMHYKNYFCLKPTKNTKSLMPKSFLRGNAQFIEIKLDELFGSS